MDSYDNTLGCHTLYFKFHMDILPDIGRSETSLLQFLAHSRLQFICYKELGSETGKEHLQGLMKGDNGELKKFRNDFRYKYITKTKIPSPAQSWSAIRTKSKEHLENYAGYITKDNQLVKNSLFTVELIESLKLSYRDKQIDVPLKKAKKSGENVSECWLSYILEKTSALSMDNKRVPIKEQCSVSSLIKHAREFVMGVKKLRNNSEHVVKNYVMLAVHNIEYLNQGGWCNMQLLQMFDDKVEQLLLFETRLN